MCEDGTYAWMREEDVEATLKWEQQEELKRRQEKVNEHVAKMVAMKHDISNANASLKAGGQDWGEQEDYSDSSGGCCLAS